jgi:hypothetical protein
MNLSEMFTPHLRKVRNVEKIDSILGREEKGVSGNNIGEKSAIKPSAPSAPILVPLDVPFVGACRYRLAGATEVRTRLDLYVADINGSWIRLHGVLIACSVVCLLPFMVWVPFRATD